nr:MAG TPA: hypothetical protein [Caudoviricetes sp.]
MPKMDKQYQLILGTFIDNKFVWHDVDSYDDIEVAYREFKKYVNSQLKYSDEELLKVWNTGRLDVELRRGNKLLNWVGIYAREVAQEAKEDEDDQADVKDGRVRDAVSDGRVFEDEDGRLVTEKQLREEFEQMEADQGPSGFNYSFEEYVKYKTGRHGTLTQVRDAKEDSKMGYKEMQARKREKFFKAIGKADDGRMYPVLTRPEFIAFKKAYAMTDKPVPLGDTVVEIFYEATPYADVSYYYDFDDNRIYMYRYNVGD